jgi:cytochrome oxidase Cu insertion factor (SCO1/SenC/PrrC family)
VVLELPVDSCRSRMRLTILSASLLLVILSVSLCLRSLGAQENTTRDFTLVDIYGMKFSLRDYRGRVVLLEFMDTLCSACRQEIPR